MTTSPTGVLPSGTDTSWAARQGNGRQSNHGVAPQRESLAEVLADAQRWAATITPAEVLSQIGNPSAADPRPLVSEELDHAA
jgi:hypothetical protein